MKGSLDDLALFGGAPTFAEPLHVGHPNVGDRTALFKRLDGILDRRWLTNGGPLVEEFEHRISTLLGVRHCVAMCNATTALQIAARALGFEGEVIVPSFTFIATAHAIRWLGLTPVFCDIDPRTHNLDPERVEAAITSRTTGIVGVHVWGRPCAVDALEDIARRHRLRLVFDAAHAFGCSDRGRMLGGRGDAEVLSFHATKIVNAFEGGALVTNDDRLAEKVRLMANFGFAGEDDVVHLGVNGKMHEASAAMGLTSLENLDDVIVVNRRNHDAYARALAGVPGISLAAYNDRERHNYQYVVLEVDEHVTGLSRDVLQAVLRAERVLARRYFHPGCHWMEPYRTLYPDVGLALRETEALAARVLLLPTGTAVGVEAVGHVSDLVRFAVARGPEITMRLGRTTTAVEFHV